MHPERLVAFMLYQSQLQEYVGNLLDACTSMYRSAGAATGVFEKMDRAPKLPARVRLVRRRRDDEAR